MQKAFLVFIAFTLRLAIISRNARKRTQLDPPDLQTHKHHTPQIMNMYLNRIYGLCTKGATTVPGLSSLY